MKLFLNKVLKDANNCTIRKIFLDPALWCDNLARRIT